VVPIAASAPHAARLVRGAQLKFYKRYPHGMLATHADVLNQDILNFVRR
jgi:non-heme chloroperoxidase